MKKILLICFLLFSCVSTSHKNNTGSRPTSEERSQTAERIKSKEFLLVEKDPDTKEIFKGNGEEARRK